MFNIIKKLMTSNFPKTIDGYEFCYRVISVQGQSTANPTSVNPAVLNQNVPANQVGQIAYKFTKRIVPISYNFGMTFDAVTGKKVEWGTSLFTALYPNPIGNKLITGVLKRLPLAMEYSPLKTVETTDDRKTSFNGFDYRDCYFDSNDFIDMNSVLTLNTFYTISDMFAGQQFNLSVNILGTAFWGASFSWLELN
jgi:hypothetical protein